MKKSILLSISAALLISVGGFAQNTSKLVSTKSFVTFFSTTAAEDIKAGNTASVSTIDKTTGEVIFSVPMQGFEFEKSLMQKHFNSENFLDTKSNPDAKLKARITNLDKIDLDTDGEYPATVKGELTIKGKTNPITEAGKIKVAGGIVSVESTFNISLADYGITFVKGKPSKNIAKTVEITVVAEYR